MADTTDTKRRLREYVAKLHQEAIDRVTANLDLVVPRGDGPARGPRLAATRIETRTSETSVTITYPTPVANYTNDGVSEHPIVARAGGALVFVWPAGPPELAMRRGSATFAFKSVMWKPGIGVANNIGWWDRIADEERWHLFLVGAQSSVTF